MHRDCVSNHETFIQQKIDPGWIKVSVSKSTRNIWKNSRQNAECRMHNFSTFQKTHNNQYYWCHEITLTVAFVNFAFPPCE